MNMFKTIMIFMLASNLVQAMPVQAQSQTVKRAMGNITITTPMLECGCAVIEIKDWGDRLEVMSIRYNN